MEVASIFVSGVRAVVTASEPVPAGIVGATVRMRYDELWEGLHKTLVFRGDIIRDVTDAGEVAVIPAEVVAKPGTRLRVGVYGTDAEGVLVIPTLWAELGRVRAAADPSGDESTEAELPVWAQILGKMGSLDDLTTEAKASLVDAVNEIARRDGVQEEVLWQMVEEYLRENPAADLTGYATEQWVKESYARKEEIPAVPVQSVNGKTGAVRLGASDVGAEPAGAVAEHNASEESHGDLRQALKELDDSIPGWAREETKPGYSKSEVGLGNVDNEKQYSVSNPPPYPVSSVNGQTGAVQLGASDVGARADSWMPTAAEVGAVPNTQMLTVTGVDAEGVSHSWTVYGVTQ